MSTRLLAWTAAWKLAAASHEAVTIHYWGIFDYSASVIRAIGLL